MKTNQKLKALKKLLSSEKNWTQGAYARDKQNRPCDPSSENAVSWCLRGACFKVGFGFPYSFFQCDIVALNDNPKTTHKDILREIDNAF